VWCLLALLLVLTVLPVMILVIGSFLSQPPRAMHFDFAGLTLANYRAVLSDSSAGHLLANTFGSALAGTLGATLIGAGLSWLAVRTDVPGRRMLETVALIPMLIPPLVGAFAWDILASPRSGLVNIAGRAAHFGTVADLYSLPGISFVYAIYYAPYVFLFVSAALRNLDPSLEEAAAICGAGRLRTILRVTLPLIAPALLSSVLLVFVFLLEIFAIPAVLGEPGDVHVMAVRIWELIGFAPPRVNQASALSVLMLLITVSLVLLQHRILRGRSFVTVAGKGVRPKRLALGAARWPLAVLGFVYVILVVVMPFAALLLVSLRKSVFFSTLTGVFDPAQLGLDQFESTLSDPVVAQSLENSLFVSLATVILGSLLYFAIAYVVTRTRLRGRRMLDIVAMLPLALPGLIIGLGYLWTWISLPVGVYGTLWVIVLAYVSQFSPQGVRAISNSLVQIHPELEESARVCGAGFFYTLRRVVAPLAWPGLQSSMILLLVFSFREMSTALFLYTADTQVFAVTMFDYWVQGTTGSVAVMTLVQTAILLVLILAGQSLRRPESLTAAAGSA
jgi:iron(III) transport system permease protein